MERVGIYRNSYKQYQKWGSIANFDDVSFIILNWAFWFTMFYFIGGIALVAPSVALSSGLSVFVSLITKVTAKEKTNAKMEWTSIEAICQSISTGQELLPANGTTIIICILQVHVQDF
jgi:hypothetical protein